MNIYSIEICLFTLLYNFKFEVDQLKRFQMRFMSHTTTTNIIFFNYLFSLLVLTCVLHTTNVFLTYINLNHHDKY